ncbi:MAG: tetratricopeptide repeat protein, partial [Candidatus Krumholzibacteriia bacterium]
MRKTLVITILAGILLAPLRASAPVGEHGRLLQGLRNKIAELRSGGNFEVAVLLAEELVTSLRSDEATRRDQMVDAEWLLRTTRMLAALPDSTQERMVVLESWKREYGGLLDRRAYEQAERVIHRVIATQKEILGTVHPETAASLVELARVRMRRLKYASADSLFDEGLVIQGSTLGRNHIKVASTLASRARLFAGMNKYSVADSLSRQALVIRVNLLGADDPLVARSLQDYAAIRVRLQDPVAAEAFLRRAYEILRERYGESDPTVVRQLQDLADLLSGRCDHAAAARLYEKALSVQLRKYGANHLHVALLRRDLAKSLAAVGDYEGAEVMYRQSLDVLNKRLDPNHEIVARVLNELGMVLFRLGRAGEAANQFDRALAICRRVHGPGGIAEAAVLCNYGILFQETSEFAKAREYFAQATEIYRERLGETSPLFARALFHMARALTGQHEYAQARLLLVESCRILENNRRRMRTCSDAIEIPHARMSPYRLLAFNELQMGNGTAAFSALERDRADSLVTRFDTRWFRRLNAAEARQERYLLEKLMGLEQVAADRVIDDADGAPDNGQESMRDQLIRAQASWDILQERLRARYPAAEGYAADLAEVRASLPAGGVLIGWMDVEGRHYVYLVAPYGEIVWRELAPAVGDSVYTRLRSMLADPGADRDALRRLAGQVYDCRLAPLEPYLERLGTLFVVPSGPMLGIPVELLPVRGRRIGALCEVCYVPSGSILRWLRTQPPSTAQASLLAVGDPPFNDEHLRDMYLDDHAQDASPPLPEAVRTKLFGMLLAGESGAAARLPRLVGTREEINKVSRFFARNAVLLGPDASETRIEALLRSLPRFGFVHLATYAAADRTRGGRSALILSQADTGDVLEAIARGRKP